MNARSSAASDPAPHRGSRHWWWQRVSALALVPLTLWFVFAILGHIDDGQDAARAWIARPGVAAALAAYLVLLFFHAQLGLQVVVEDYVSAPSARAKIVLAMKAVNLLAGAVAVFSVLRIAW